MLRARPAHDSRRRLLLLGPRPAQVGAVADHASHALHRRRRLPVVFLGLQLDLLPHWQRLHRRSVQLRPHEDPRPALRRQHQGPRSALLLVPGNVRRYYVSLARVVRCCALPFLSTYPILSLTPTLYSNHNRT